MTDGRSLTVSPRPKIPADIARQLRREAGFGCCKCGTPILQYHHIVTWSSDQHYRPQDMMVLCPLHHDQATKGAMPISEQRQLKASPFNIRNCHAKGLLEVKQDYCAADLGTITVVGEGCFLRILGQEILSLSLSDQNLELSLKLFSPAGELLVDIYKNEWVAGDPMPWDIKADWQVLTLYERSRRISVSLNAKTVPLQIQGEFYYDNRRVSVTNRAILIEGTPNTSFSNFAFVGGGIDVNTSNVQICFGGQIISWSDKRARLWKARDLWRKIKSERNGQIS